VQHPGIGGFYITSSYQNTTNISFATLVRCHKIHDMIHIENLHKTYATPRGSYQALRGIDLRIEQGEVFGVIGPSGAGKSTLVKCINLLERPDQGSIAIGGQVLAGLSEAQLRGQRRRIGMVFQHFNLLTRRTVYGNVALPLEIAGVPRSEIPARVERLLELVGLSHLRDHHPNRISGGQKQRVGIARALANNPDVLLSDEATSALDPETTRNILALLRDINRKTGITVVLITHQMEVVRQICDRVAVLDQGLVVEAGRTLDVFSAPRENVTRAMVSAVTASELSDETLAALRERIAQARTARPAEASRLWRLALAGGDSGALLSDLSRAHGVSLALVQARVEDIQGIAVGTLFVLAQGAPAALEAALQSARARQVTVQEIIHESATAQSALHLAA
jgi:D-methionine transport system ATP-binding protein